MSNWKLVHFLVYVYQGWKLVLKYSQSTKMVQLYLETTDLVTFCKKIGKW